MIDKITNIKYPYCQKILPLVYDDSLSYYETLCKFTTKMNELIDSINSISVDILNEAKAYTDGAIRNQQATIDAKMQELVRLVDNTVEEFDNKLEELQKQYDNFTRYTDAQITFINGKVDGLSDKIDADIIGVNARTDLAIKQNNDYIFDVIGKQLLGNIKVINWFTGEPITIQEMFDYLAIEFHSADSATIDYINSTNYTVDMMIALNETVTNLVTHGKSLIV